MDSNESLIVYLVHTYWDVYEVVDYTPEEAQRQLLNEFPTEVSPDHITHIEPINPYTGTTIPTPTRLGDHSNDI